MNYDPTTRKNFEYKDEILEKHGRIFSQKILENIVPN